MAVFSIWESRFPPERAEEGLGDTRAIWEDMLSFAGYLDDEIVRDLDDPGHLIVVSRWESREAADEALELYRENSNAVRANELVSEPRRRVVGTAVGSAEPEGAPGGRPRELGWASGASPAHAPRGTLSLASRRGRKIRSRHRVARMQNATALFMNVVEGVFCEVYRWSGVRVPVRSPQ